MVANAFKGIWKQMDLFEFEAEQIPEQAGLYKETLSQQNKNK